MQRYRYFSYPDLTVLKAVEDTDVCILYRGSAARRPECHFQSAPAGTDENMIGNPSRGKTHIAIGIGLEAVAQGKSVLFKNAATLSTELVEAIDNYQLGKLEKNP